MRAIEIKGVDKLIRQIQEQPKEVKKKADFLIGNAVQNAVERAVDLAPRDTGFLANGIGSTRNGDLDYTFFSHSRFSAFVEFGTRTRVQVPRELQAYAAQFKGKSFGEGTAWENIKEWCRRKRIEKELWWPIYKSIMTKGTHAHPFFFPAFFEARNRIRKDLEKLTNEKSK